MRHFWIVGCLVLSDAAMAQNADDKAYIERLKQAAPASVVDQATIERMDGDNMKIVRQGTNRWTCMDAQGDWMCSDPGGMEWMQAWMSHGPAPAQNGFMYMLSGDAGASNTDPYATEQKPDNHWIKTGPHVMITGPAAKGMQGYSRDAEPDVTKPYVMWPNTPYEHLMVPVAK